MYIVIVDREYYKDEINYLAGFDRKYGFPFLTPVKDEAIKYSKMEDVQCAISHSQRKCEIVSI